MLNKATRLLGPMFVFVFCIAIMVSAGSAMWSSEEYDQLDNCEEDFGYRLCGSTSPAAQASSTAYMGEGNAEYLYVEADFYNWLNNDWEWVYYEQNSCDNCNTVALPYIPPHWRSVCQHGAPKAYAAATHFGVFWDELWSPPSIDITVFTLGEEDCLPE